MEMVIKVRGITRKWLVNVLTVVVGVIFTAEIVFGVFFTNYYYSSVANTASGYSQPFRMLEAKSRAEFSNFAREYAEQFEYKHKVEVQVIDYTGKVIVTTSGFAPEQGPMPDYAAAAKSVSGTARWRGTTSSGEKIMAGTTLLYGGNGAVRWVVSLEDVNRHIAMIIIIVGAIGLCVILLAAVSGLYFIKSIVKPVQEVSNIARRIAMGDFKARIEVRENDEIGELCDSINYMASELSQAENLKNDFISSVSHELRTPLTAIRGWGETVKMSVGTDPQLVEKGMDVILSEADRLSGLVEELLDFSRMQSGRLTMQMERTDILDQLGEAVYMYEEIARQQGIELSFVEPKSLPPVIGDGNRLKQVFINIIDNAIKYTNSGGQVLVEAVEEEGCVRITITDTGVGIPAQDVDRVKEKFFKSNKSVRGSGIGLAVADEIVKQHKGLLFLESKEGVGTTVTIVLPIAPALPEEEEQTAVDIPPAAVTIPGEAAVHLGDYAEHPEHTEHTEHIESTEPAGAENPEERNQENEEL